MLQVPVMLVIRIVHDYVRQTVSVVYHRGLVVLTLLEEMKTFE
jgi:hypothetical protein